MDAEEGAGSRRTAPAGETTRTDIALAEPGHEALERGRDCRVSGEKPAAKNAASEPCASRIRREPATQKGHQIPWLVARKR
jgi:hypothetical protein